MTPVFTPLVHGPTVQLFILSRDRPSFCREAVASAVTQTYAGCEIIVSDNSAGEEVAEMLAREFPTVMVLRRRPPLPALGHFNQLIHEAQARLMVLFHDDDVLEPDYVARMVALFEQYPDISAVGCNARIIQGQRLTRRLFMGDFQGACLLRQPLDLLEPYLSLSLTSPAPFPGYMYRTNVIRGLKLATENGGKHADVSFLSGVLTRAPILWTDECLFRYRFHGNNDSSYESIANRLSWLRHIYVTAGVQPKSRAVMDYKFMYWWRWLQQTAPGFRIPKLLMLSHNHRRSVARRFVLCWGVRIVLTRVDFWRRAWRVARRWLFSLR